MKKIDFLKKYEDKVFLIVGFTYRTGYSVAKFFDDNSIKYKISDLKKNQTLLSNLKNCIDFFSGSQTSDQLEGIDIIILSPGIPKSIPLIKSAENNNISVFSDIDFLFPLFEEKEIIAVTGTDGKTTTVILLKDIFSNCKKVKIAGNIGIPIASLIEDLDNFDSLILEMSSFLLEDLKNFKPNISTVLNIAKDHLNRYLDLEEYAKTKFNIVKFSNSSDYFVKNLDNKFTSKFDKENINIKTISKEDKKADYYFFENNFYCKDNKFSFLDCKITGKHNIENILVAIAISDIAKIPFDIIESSVKNFSGVSHRLEFVGTYKKIDVYNDSKATTVHATIAAIDSFPKNIILIMGGQDKGLDFSAIKNYENRIKFLICYGEAGEYIRSFLNFENSIFIKDFVEAVSFASYQAEKGNVILLSPGCTSWDQHSSFEERGDIFKKTVKKILG
jgi:UDP-N-acetylmuramoylalanine--D-glutamate ligase